MPGPLLQVLAYTAAPAAALAVGGAVASAWPPPPHVRSYLQHLAAGVVFAALAVEILPDVVHRRAPVAASIGFALGVAAMLGIRELSRRYGGEGPADGGTINGPPAGNGDGEPPGAAGMAGAWASLGVVATDILVDGLLIGVAFAAGAREGVLVTVALAVELLSLGLATGAALGARGLPRARAAGVVAALAVLPLLGAGVGVTLLGGLGGGWMEGVLAFAAAALLYLVTEELLVEAHEVPETPLTTAMFFAGFLLLLVLDMVA